MCGSFLTFLTTNETKTEDAEQRDRSCAVTHSGSSSSARICMNIKRLTAFWTLCIKCPSIYLGVFTMYSSSGRLSAPWVCPHMDEQSETSWHWCCAGQSNPVITVDVHFSLLLNTLRKNRDTKRHTRVHTQAKPAGKLARVGQLSLSPSLSICFQLTST